MLACTRVAKYKRVGGYLIKSNLYWRSNTVDFGGIWIFSGQLPPPTTCLLTFFTALQLHNRIANFIQSRIIV